LVAIVSDPRFVPQDLIGFTANKRNQLLDNLDEEPENASASWKRNVAVPFQVPEGKHCWTNAEGRTFVAPGLHHRSITQIVRMVFETKANLHYTPFEMWWKVRPDAPAERIYSDLYTSSAFIEAHREVNFNPAFQVPGCKLEKVVAAIMVWSDSTHLAQFGTAKLWPIYAFTGNMAKWFRCKPSSNSCEHWAYIPSVCGIVQWGITGCLPVSLMLRMVNTSFLMPSRISYGRYVGVKLGQVRCLPIAGVNLSRQYGHCFLMMILSRPINMASWSPVPMESNGEFTSVY
jgi:Plavaka transposase